MLDLVSLISVATGVHSVASGYNQGKDLKRIISKLDSLDQKMSSLRDELYLPNLELLVPQHLNNPKLITDIREIEQEMSEIKKNYDSLLHSGQERLPIETEIAMKEEPWYFLKESRPLKGASLKKEGHIPILFEFEGIKFVGWKETKFIQYSFNFKIDSKTGLLMPMSYYNIRRNAICPCGSGLKYKRCCGKIL